jgi:hypothetical protein
MEDIIKFTNFFINKVNRIIQPNNNYGTYPIHYQTPANVRHNDRSNSYVVNQSSSDMLTESVVAEMLYPYLFNNNDIHPQQQFQQPQQPQQQFQQPQQQFQQQFQQPQYLMQHHQFARNHEVEEFQRNGNVKQWKHFETIRSDLDKYRN